MRTGMQLAAQVPTHDLLDHSSPEGTATKPVLRRSTIHNVYRNLIGFDLYTTRWPSRAEPSATLTSNSFETIASG